MTWEELKEKAKEMGYRFYNSLDADGHYEWFCKNGVTFEDNGIVCFCGETLSEHRTPEQMLMIMRGLE